METNEDSISKIPKRIFYKRHLSCTENNAYIRIVKKESLLTVSIPCDLKFNNYIQINSSRVNYNGIAQKKKKLKTRYLPIIEISLLPH